MHSVGQDLPESREGAPGSGWYVPGTRGGFTLWSPFRVHNTASAPAAEKQFGIYSSNPWTPERGACPLDTHSTAHGTATYGGCAHPVAGSVRAESEEGMLGLTGRERNQHPDERGFQVLQGPQGSILSRRRSQTETSAEHGSVTSPAGCQHHLLTDKRLRANYSHPGRGMFTALIRQVVWGPKLLLGLCTSS